MRVKIIVDSTADMIPAVADRVGIVPLTVRFGDKEYVSGVDIDNRKFYELLAESDVLPTTSQPTPFAFAKAFEEAVKEGYEVVCITCSGRLSGTNQSANIAADDFDGKVTVVDSNTIAISAGLLVQYALELVDQGLSAAEIVAALEQKKDKVRLLALVDTLEYLKKGGRVSPTVAFAGGLLNIKPLITVADGEIRVLGKARGNKQGNNLMNQEAVKQGLDRTMPMMVGYTGTSEELLKKYLQDSAELVAADTPVTMVGSVVGTHAGPGAVALAFFAEA
jgi:DegV family protein with EDD domain